MPLQQCLGARHRRAAEPAARRPAAQPGRGPIDAQQRVTIMADARSNSVLVRADNPGRACARAAADRAARHARPARRQHVHRLPEECRGRARGADAARDAERRRRPAAPHPAARRCRRRRRCSWATLRWRAPCRPRPPRRRRSRALRAAGATSLFGERRDDHGRHARAMRSSSWRPSLSTTTSARSSRSSTCAARRCSSRR